MVISGREMGMYSLNQFINLYYLWRKLMRTKIKLILGVIVMNVFTPQELIFNLGAPIVYDFAL